MKFDLKRANLCAILCQNLNVSSIKLSFLSLHSSSLENVRQSAKLGKTAVFERNKSECLLWNILSPESSLFPSSASGISLASRFLPPTTGDSINYVDNQTDRSLMWLYIKCETHYVIVCSVFILILILLRCSIVRSFARESREILILMKLYIYVGRGEINRMNLEILIKSISIKFEKNNFFTGIFRNYLFLKFY